VAVPDARPLFLALALEAAPLGVVRLARFAWRRSAYVATLITGPATAADPWTALTWAMPQDSPLDVFSRGN